MSVFTGLVQHLNVRAGFLMWQNKSFGQAFTKACEIQRRRLWSPAAAGETLRTEKRRRGAETVRWTVSAWGTLAGGSPARSATKRNKPANTSKVRAGFVIDYCLHFHKPMLDLHAAVGVNGEHGAAVHALFIIAAGAGVQRIGQAHALINDG